MTRREWPALAPARPLRRFPWVVGRENQPFGRDRRPTSLLHLAVAFDGVRSDEELARPVEGEADGEDAGS
jgi:hypothetical protein